MLDRRLGRALMVGIGAVLRLAQTDPQAIQRMAATERAFAAATAEIGVRDGFLTFFADDAVAIDAGASGAKAATRPAKTTLRAQALPALPLPTRLRWAPFTGQVSADGTLGWLTGPYTNMSERTQDLVGKGAYFSVWRRQPDGTWRVWLDEGIGLPDLWRDTGEFRAAPEPDAGSSGAPSDSLDETERMVAGAGESWLARLATGIRLHRDGHMPMVGRDAVATWAASSWRAVHYSTVQTLTAASGDLGVALGGYDLGAEHGTWVRVWKRDAGGRWRLVFETSKPAR